jgi:hypothetical protein
MSMATRRKDAEGVEPEAAQDLGAAAGAALAAVPDHDGSAIEPLEGTDYTKVKFVGVAFDELENAPKIGDELAFNVRGRCVGVGEEQMADGHIRKTAKIKTFSVTPILDGE